MDKGDEEPIYRIRGASVRIRITREDMPVMAVWLVVGRPGYIAHKEDGDGKKEDWKEAFCMCCGVYATTDHLASVKHLEKVASATWNIDAKGYGDVLRWVEIDAVENAIDMPKERPELTAPPTAADSSDEESPDRAAPAPEEVVRLVPQLNFEDWPFELLEVDLWTKKQKDNWGRMDGEMAEAIKKEAQKGGTKFRIVYGKTKKWTYEIDFMKWTQLNVGTGTERRMRFGVL
jgi:hypothetical protein